jgi:hypothetical protein
MSSPAAQTLATKARSETGMTARLDKRAARVDPRTASPHGA